MAEEKLNVLYTIDDKEFPSMDYINVLEKWKGYPKNMRKRCHRKCLKLYRDRFVWRRSGDRLGRFCYGKEKKMAI